MSALTTGIFTFREQQATPPDHTFDSVQVQKRGRGRPKKDPFEAVPSEYKDETAGLSVEELNLKLAEVAKNEMENKQAYKEDQQILELKEQLKDASAQYREATEANTAKMLWLKRLVEDKGG